MFIKRARTFVQSLPQMVYWMLLVGLFGLFLLIFPRTTTDVVLAVVGAMLLVAGVFSVARYFILDAKRAMGGWLLSSGCGLIVAGILLYTFTNLLIGLMPFLFGCALLVGGVVKLQGALDLARVGYGRWFWSLIGAVISLILGVLLVVRPFAAGIAFTQLIGASLLVEAVQDITYAIRFGRLKRRFME